MTEHRWVWAGIAVRDEEGNMLMLQMNDPQGQVESSLEVEVVRGRIPNTREYIPGRTLLRVHLRGYAHEWTPGPAQTRKATSINGRTQEIESTHREMEDHGFIEDGYGSAWPRCGADCQMEVVRPGKVQCSCDFPEEAMS